GQGTTMCLYLPRFFGDGELEAEPSTRGIDESAEGELILLVEDEHTIRELLTEELRELGYQVIAVGNGAAGLEVLQSNARIDLLLTDVGLPGGLNGRQVADAGRETRPDLKVLFLTGYAQNAAVGNGLLGPDMEVLTKPFDIEVLATKVRRILER
ncbi:MAG: response regulator, partial [Burkholderiaceae bacterium]